MLQLSFLLSFLCFVVNYRTLSGQAQPGDQVKKLLDALTLEEKVSLLVGTGMDMPAAPPQQGQAPAETKTQTHGAAVGSTKKLVPGAAGTTNGVDRLGITPIVVADGPAGLRIDQSRPGDPLAYYCTAFPVGTLLASTWDEALVNKVGQAMGQEMIAYGVDILLGPGMNIQRNPLCGRNFEYYSEDPYLSGKTAASMVNGIQSNGVGTSIKHFAVNNAETNRSGLNTIVSERALREIYLEGFRIAVQEAHPFTVMSSYPQINGVYASQNTELLTTILRNDWGFNGLVMTDWFGGQDPVEQMKAGNDLLMPGTPMQKNAILEAVKNGKLDPAIIDRNVARILNVMLQSSRFKGIKNSNKPDLKDHAALARLAAADGMVLLKNTNKALPLGKKTRLLAAFGNTSYDLIIGGGGSGQVNKAYSISLAEGLINSGYEINPDLSNLYTSYLNLRKAGRPAPQGFMSIFGQKPIDELTLNQDIINGMAIYSDAAIITIGRNSTEGFDRKNIKGDFQLSDYELSMIKNVSEAFRAKGKSTIVILNVCGVIETASWKDYPDAIVLAWQGGQEMGNAIADILSGKTDPSGKLQATFPVSYEDVPSAKTFPGTPVEKAEGPAQDEKEDMMAAFMGKKESRVVYDDGIYVGYRYYETFGVKSSYEFGYGLSYTTFNYKNLKLSSSKFNGRLTVTMDITNSGQVNGKEVAELYLSAPHGKLDKPVTELKGFAKTRLLRPGESQTLTFVLDSRNLASFDPASSSWVAEAGRYEIRIGASSQDIKQTASFTLQNDLVVKKESASLVPKEKITELKPVK